MVINMAVGGAETLPVETGLAGTIGPAASAPAATNASSNSVAAYNTLSILSLDGKASEARAINDAGQVVGWAEVANGHIHAFMYSGEKMTDLGALSGDTSSAEAINSSGQVVGWSGLRANMSSSIPSLTSPRGAPPIGTIYHGFIYNGGELKDNAMVGFGASGGPQWNLGAATGINSSGTFTETVGTIASVGFDVSQPWAGIPDLSKHVAGSAMVFVGHGGRNICYGKVRSDSWGSVACALNDLGQVVGAAALDANAPQASHVAHAYFFDGKEVQSLGALGGDNSVALGLNNHGLVVGWAETGGTAGMTGSVGNPHAFLYQTGKMQDLGTLNGGTVSQANGINAAGQIVGMASIADGTFHAFLYADGKMKDLNDLVGKAMLTNARLSALTRANGINERGQIVGTAKDNNGNDVGFVLTPKPVAMANP